LRESFAAVPTDDLASRHLVAMAAESRRSRQVPVPAHRRPANLTQSVRLRSGRVRAAAAAALVVGISALAGLAIAVALNAPIPAVPDTGSPAPLASPRTTATQTDPAMTPTIVPPTAVDPGQDADRDDRAAAGEQTATPRPTATGSRGDHAKDAGKDDTADEQEGTDDGDGQGEDQGDDEDEGHGDSGEQEHDDAGAAPDAGAVSGVGR
jgi:hypothetical protein